MNVAEMTVEQFKQYLAKKRADLFDASKFKTGIHGDFSSSVKAAMQRRRTQYKNVTSR